MCGGQGYSFSSNSVSPGGEGRGNSVVKWGLERLGHKAAVKLPSVFKRWTCGTYTRPYDARPGSGGVRDMAGRSVPLGTRVRDFLREALLVEN